MKKIIAAALLLSFAGLSVANAAIHHRRHQMCHVSHHHRLCHWVR